ncbi:MAG TPA: phage holin family protein [Streptosporangiaceae bacterium]|nr:phage holin family protein [Streptosporangiaceae bacterium]
MANTVEDAKSAGELVKQITELVPRLVRDEVKLAQAELVSKGKQAGLGAGLLGGSGIIALYAVGCLLAAAIIAISGVIAAWLAALIVGVALLAVCAVASLLGAGRLKHATPPVPTQAIDSVQADVRELKEKVHR